MYDSSTVGHFGALTGTVCAVKIETVHFVHWPVKLVEWQYVEIVPHCVCPGKYPERMKKKKKKTFLLCCTIQISDNQSIFH